MLGSSRALGMLLSLKSRTERTPSRFLGFCLISHLLQVGTKREKKREWKEVHMTCTSSELHHEGWNSRLCTAHGAAVLCATLALHQKMPCSTQLWLMKKLTGTSGNSDRLISSCYSGLWLLPAKWGIFGINEACRSLIFYFWITVFIAKKFLRGRLQENLFAAGKKRGSWCWRVSQYFKHCQEFLPTPAVL